MPFYNQPLAAPLSPPLPESQTASYIIYKERHIRPHAYRPFRIPVVRNETTAHDFITRLLSMGDHVPPGAFLPSSKPQGPVALKPTAAVSRVDRPSREDSTEGSTLPKLSLRRQRTIHPQSPAVATSLGRGASCSSTASTIRPEPPKPKKAAKPYKPLPSLEILPPLPSFDIITTSPIKDTHSPASSEDEEVVTPQHGRSIELPCVAPEEVIGEEELETEVKGITTMPGTPLNIPPTPLDIPVDWDDLRQRWSPHGFAQEEEWCEGGDSTYDDISGGALVEEVEEPPVPTHAYAAGGMAPSTSVSEIKLSSITSKDLGECFLLEPMQLQLRASAIFSDGWSSFPTPPLEAGARGRTVRGPISFSSSGVGHKRSDSSPTADTGVLGSTLTLSPAAADSPLPPTAVPRSSEWSNARTPTEPLPKTATPPPLQSALKQQNQARKKRHGRLVSFDEAALVMRTVRFSCTLDPQFDYARFDQRNNSAVSIDSRLIEEIVGAGSKPRKESSLGAGESFLSVLSPVTPTVPRAP